MNIIQKIFKLLKKNFSNFMLTVSIHSLQETRQYYRTISITIVMPILLFIITMFFDNNNTIWAISWLGCILLLYFIWFFYAPLVIKNICYLQYIFPSNSQYKNLYNNYMNWQKIFKIKLPSISGFLKCIYILLWIIYIISVWFLTICKRPFGNYFNAALTSFLSTISIILNFYSYYICTVFVIFLSKLSKIDNLDYIKQLPSTTHAFQILKDTASTIYMYFLIDSILCTALSFIFWQVTDLYRLLYTYDIISLLFKYMFGFLFIGTILTWIAICLLSRAYLNILHYKWKFQSSIEFQKEYDKSNTSNKRKNKIISIKEKLYNDKISVNIWNIILALITLSANFATIINIIDPDFFASFFQNENITQALYILKVKKEVTAKKISCYPFLF